MPSFKTIVSFLVTLLLVGLVSAADMEFRPRGSSSNIKTEIKNTKTTIKNEVKKKVTVNEENNPVYNTQAIQCPNTATIMCCTSDPADSKAQVCTELQGAAVQCIGAVTCCNNQGNNQNADKGSNQGSTVTQSCGTNINNWSNFSPSQDTIFTFKPKN